VLDFSPGGPNMRSQQDGDLFAIPKAIFSIVVLVVVLCFVGRNGCPRRDEPQVVWTSAPKGSPEPSRDIPFRPVDAAEAAAVEAIRAAGGNANSNGEGLMLWLPGPLPSVPLLAKLRDIKHPISLSLWNSGITDEDLVLLAGLEQLHYLNLSGTAVTDEGMASLSGLKHLKQLELTDTLVTGAGLRHIGSLTGLEELSLEGTAADDAGLAELVGLRALRTLHLNRTRVTDDGLEYLAVHPHLVTVYLQGTAVSAVQERKLGGGLMVLQRTDIPGVYYAAHPAREAAERAAASWPIHSSSPSHTTTNHRAGRRR